MIGNADVDGDDVDDVEDNDVDAYDVDDIDVDADGDDDVDDADVDLMSLHRAVWPEGTETAGACLLNKGANTWFTTSLEISIYRVSIHYSSGN